MNTDLSPQGSQALGKGNNAARPEATRSGIHMKPEDNKVVVPADNSTAKPTTETVKPDSEDAEFEKDLEALNNNQPAPKLERSELERATFTAKSTLKRIKELGGNPAELLGDEVPAPVQEKPVPVDESKFVTKLDFAKQEASRLAKSPSELKVMMWWIENKGMTVEDAHYMANKGRTKKILSEVTRSTTTVPANVGGGAGQRPADQTNAPDLPEVEKQRLIQSGMRYDPAKKAYVGKKIQHRFDETSKQWVTERI